MLKDIYWGLPGALQSVAASFRGRQLQSRRYGAETEELVSAALERDSWSEERWKAWQEERLARLLHHAATKVPYYRDHWAERRRRGDKASPEILQNWPLLGKQQLREKPEAFVADDADVRKMFESETSGTTGTPLRLWQRRRTFVGWYALFEARIRRWNGVSLYDRWAHTGGQRVTPIARRRPPFWVWNGPMRQLYMSIYHIVPAAGEAYIRALRKYRIDYIFGYASAMHALARIVLDQGLQAPAMKVAVSNAEPFFQFQRDAIAAAFQCPVRDTYGQAEIVCGASECPEGTLHLWPEVGMTEWLADDADVPVERGRTGRIICTAFLNPDMPLIRYVGGDRGILGDVAACSCGRGLPAIRSLEGRTADLVLTPDGSPVGGLDTVFHAGLPIREAQIVQETLHRIRINAVPADGFGTEHERDLIDRIQARMGKEVEVVVDRVTSIPRTPAGKFRVQVSLLPDRGQVLS
jgi:phenylacetate-CoA ligase